MSSWQLKQTGTKSFWERRPGSVLEGKWKVLLTGGFLLFPQVIYPCRAWTNITGRERSFHKIISSFFPEKVWDKGHTPLSKLLEELTAFVLQWKMAGLSSKEVQPSLKQSACCLWVERLGISDISGRGEWVATLDSFPFLVALQRWTALEFAVCHDKAQVRLLSQSRTLDLCLLSVH